MKKIYGYIVLIVLFLSAVTISAQVQDFKSLKQDGIELYNKGEFRDAMSTLARAGKFKEAENDAELWNYLGLSYLERDDAKNALKSLEKAAKIAPLNAVYRSNLAFLYLMERKINKAQAEIEKAIAIDPNSANAYYIRGMANLWERKSQDALADAEKGISVNPKYSPAYVLKADVFIYEFGKGWAEKSPLKDNVQWLARAQEALEICEKDCVKDQNFKDAESKLDSVKAFYKHFKKVADYKDGVAEKAAADPNRTPMKIVAKPRASYTDRARRNGLSGTVTMAVVFAADREVKQILILSGLGYGLNEEAMKAAKNIVFEPETENGKPVTVVKTIQYSFKVY